MSVELLKRACFLRATRWDPAFDCGSSCPYICPTARLTTGYTATCRRPRADRFHRHYRLNYAVAARPRPPSAEALGPAQAQCRRRGPHPASPLRQGPGPGGGGRAAAQVREHAAQLVAASRRTSLCHHCRPAVALMPKQRHRRGAAPPLAQTPLRWPQLRCCACPPIAPPLRSLSAFGEVAVLVVDGTQLVTEVRCRCRLSLVPASTLVASSWRRPAAGAGAAAAKAGCLWPVAGARLTAS